MSTVMLQVVEPRGAPCGGTRGRGAVVLDKNQNFGNRLVLVDIMIHNPSRARTTTNPQKQHSITDNLGALRVSRLVRRLASRHGTARRPCTMGPTLTPPCGTRTRRPGRASPSRARSHCAQSEAARRGHAPSAESRTRDKAARPATQDSSSRAAQAMARASSCGTRPRWS